jgi:hypothetical protein
MKRTETRRDSLSQAAGIELNPLNPAPNETGVAVLPPVPGVRRQTATQINYRVVARRHRPVSNPTAR